MSSPNQILLKHVKDLRNLFAEQGFSLDNARDNALLSRVIRYYGDNGILDLPEVKVN